MEWINVKDRLPEEHDSIFISSYGTDKWKSGMFKSISDEVLVTLKFEDGSKAVETSKIIDGKWKKPIINCIMKLLIGCHSQNRQRRNKND